MKRLRRVLSVILTLALPGCATFSQRDLSAAKGAAYGAACATPIALGVTTANIGLIIIGSAACVGLLAGANQPEPAQHLVFVNIVRPTPEPISLVAFIYGEDAALRTALEKGLEERGWNIYRYEPRPQEVTLISAERLSATAVRVRIVLPNGNWFRRDAGTVEEALAAVMRKAA